jgi:hypothetical protein
VNPPTVKAVLSLPIPQQGAMNPTLQTVTITLQRASALGSSGYILYKSPAGTTIQLATGTNVTARAVTLAGQGSLDIVATSSGVSQTDDFRKFAEIGIALV